MCLIKGAKEKLKFDTAIRGCLSLTVDFLNFRNGVRCSSEDGSYPHIWKRNNKISKNKEDV